MIEEADIHSTTARNSHFPALCLEHESTGAAVAHPEQQNLTRRLMDNQGLTAERVAHAGRREAGRKLSSDFTKLISDSLRLADVAVVVGCGLVCYFAYSTLTHQILNENYFRAIAVAAFLAIPVLQWSGLYRQPLLRSAVLRSAGPAFFGSGGLFCLMLIIGFAAHSLHTFSRIWAVSWAGATFTALVVERVAVHAALRRLQSRGVLREAIAIVGSGPLVDRLVTYLNGLDHSLVEIVGIFDDRTTRLPDDSLKPHGTLDDLLELGRRQQLERVIIALPWSAEARILNIMRRLKAQSIDIALCPDLAIFSLPQKTFDYVGNLPTLRVAERPLRRWDAVIKQIEDRVLGALFLAIAMPVMLAVALVIRLDSPGPVLFRQKRHGFNNTEIDVWKFRTMYHDMVDHAGAQQTQRNDARVTRVGNALRRLSLDELPQLINVMQGSMSLVGPRPHPVGMRTHDLLCHEIVEDYAHRHRVKPGITGWAQVHGYRGATEDPEQLRRRTEYDLFYIEKWSLLLDLKIIFLTVWQVFQRTNAF
jgi:Undecaprenyl-phosphate glucose phosphotransferase